MKFISCLVELLNTFILVSQFFHILLMSALRVVSIPPVMKFIRFQLKIK